MKRLKELNGSAAEVEAAFYDALHRADLEALMALWADDEEIVCIHPGGARLIGHAAIRASWETILAAGGLHIVPAQLHETHNLMSSVHTVIEGHQATPEDVIRIADEALYRAKDDGRNCVRHSVVVA